MLTIDDILFLAKEGVNVVISKEEHPLGWKGEWLSNKNEAVIYMPHIDSENDFNITLLHELIHARNYHSVIDDIIEDDEEEVEEEATYTFYHDPQVVEFVRDLYNLNN